MVNYHEAQEALQLYEFLDKIIDDNAIVIVEGIKDKKALEDFGISNIIVLNRRPLYAVVEKVATVYDKAKKLTGERISVIILTDLDAEGKKLYGKLNSGLQNFGVRIDNRFREFLFKHTKLRQIEGMKNYITRLEKDIESIE
ncbi:TPA: toprim domain-containing protein [Candidatus Woesearchaeota archaeon]|nr:toprim domain-containing protein [Candidatus Woesearchaeota archaeon]